jgi:PAS domain S-box-containing protein
MALTLRGLRMLRGIRGRLVMLVGAALFPVLIFAIGGVVSLADRERDAIETGLRSTARSLALGLDREIDSSITALQALTASSALQSDDYPAFHEQLAKVRADARAPWVTAAVIDGAGRILLSLNPTLESAFPPTADPEFFRPFLAGARPWVAHETAGVSAGTAAHILVAVPITRGGRTDKALVALLASDSLAAVVWRYRVPAGGSVYILDARSSIVARVSATDPLDNGALDGDVARLRRTGWEGLSQFVTESGRSMYGAYARSPEWGWTVSLIVPASTVDGSWRRWLATVIGGGTMLLLLGVSVALLAARGVASPIAALARSAEALGRGEVPRPPPSGVTELDEVGRAITEAAMARRRAETALRQSEARLQTTLRDIADAVIVTDADARVTFMNPVAEALTGWKGDEVRGLPLASIFTLEDEATGERVEAPVGSALHDGAVASVADHLALSPRHGGAIPIDESAALIRGDDGRTAGVVLVFRDVTERRRVDQARRESARELEVRAGQQASAVALGQRALAGPDIDTLLDDAAQTLCSTLGANLCQVLELDAEGLLLRAAVGGDRNLVGRPAGTVTADSLAGYALRTRAPVVIDDLQAETRFRATSLPGAPGAVSGVTVVIPTRAQPYGLLSVYTTAARTFTRDDVNFLQSIANILAAALERTRADAERADLLQRERAARTDAEAASRAKDEFLAMLGHELRNPLAAIANASQVLEEGVGADAPEGRLIAIVARQAQHLSRMVGDLLDVSRVSSGKINLSPEFVDLRDVAERAVAAFREAGRVARHDLSVSVQSVVVRGDPTRLEQIVWNLLDNALKYTPPGGQVHLGVSRDEEGVATLRVRDTGVGIAPELLPHIFDLFVQGRRSIDRAEGGLGLGLTLVRRLVEFHGGTVMASSDGAGKGSEFIVRVPAVMGSSARAPHEGGASPPRPQRILVVEDNADAREALVLLLESWGHQVTQAADGLSGLEVARSAPPDVALIDVGLPGIDGYALARELRGVPDCAAVRLIALTGYSRAQDRERGRAAGFDTYLVKPVDPGQLRVVLSPDPSAPDDGAPA